ncbi:Uncharacterised protein [Pseudomonas aeruginosa]|nr:Uncharacterised protein [Pseudomonas aeruginosa]
MLKPRASMAAMTALGGAAPPVITDTGTAGTLACSAWISIDITTGAALRWVTACSAMAAWIASGWTLRRHTCVPPDSVTAQVWLQPLQWNIGKVHR